jgi:pre-mRNA-splicing factor CDC5/CEF1
LVSNYSNTVGATPTRTPRAPQEEDRIANELRNARARTETQSALFGGENTPLHESNNATTGYEGIAPSKQASFTPNPLATPLRNGMNGTMGPPSGRNPGATPMRTPRDNFSLNQNDGASMVGQTPRDIRIHEPATGNSLRGKLAALPKPKETEWELELPEEQDEAAAAASKQLSVEDAAIRDARNAQLAEAAALADFRRQTQVVQKGLPRLKVVDVEAMLRNAREISDPIERSIAEEMALLMANDARKFGGAKVKGDAKALQSYDKVSLERAQREVILEIGQHADREAFGAAFEWEWQRAHASSSVLPGLAGYAEDEMDEEQLLIEAFDNVQESISSSAEKGLALEKKLAKVHGGYMERQKKLRQKVVEAAAFLEKTKLETEVSRTATMAESATLGERLERLREEVGVVGRREREAQDEYRALREELEALGS